MVHGILAILVALAAAAQAQNGPQDVTDLDLDDLIKVRVTSPSRKEQAVEDVPAAVYVIRQEDLKRSGVRTLADALRAVPGMQVARPKANSWAVSGRGFNSTSANKLLVLLDGRSVYSPLHSGVFWDVQDAFLEDIERIEVVRGPGGTLWGANAINGVVNVISKRAEDTQGAVILGGAGTEERAFGGARYGFKISDDVSARAYAKYVSRDEAVTGIDPDRHAYDAMWLARTGFRGDARASDRDRLTFMADFYEGQAQTTSTTPSLTAPFSSTINERASLRGGDVVIRWDRSIEPGSDLALQTYYDYSSRLQSLFGYVLHTLDTEFLHRFRLFDDHEINWGLGYRVYWSDVHESFTIQADPESDTNHLLSAFLQDEFPLVKDHLRMTFGTKIEYNSFSGVEVQPSVRLAWRPDHDHMVWMAASRAVRTPSSLDQDLRINAAVIPGAPPTVLAVFGDKDFKSEELYAFEIGYRVQPADPVSIDLALFHHRYDDLRSLETGSAFLENAPPPPHNVTPFILSNQLRARTYGAEVAVNVRPASWWLLQASYTHLRMNIDPARGSTDTTSEAGERQNPRNQVWVRSAMDLPWNLALDVVGRYVDRLPAYAVDSYVEADVRLAWQHPTKSVEAALVGQNLLHDSHPEFSSKASRSEIQRGVYASLTVRF